MKVMTFYVLLLTGITFCGKEAAQTDGSITYLKGNAIIEHIEADGSKKTIAAKVGEKVFVGDTIVTADSSTAVFEVIGAQMEIQKNSRFVYARGGNDKEVYLQGGNAWTSVSKLENGRKFNLRTPNTVAGVRGTKFYTFTDGKNAGTCHCEGKVVTKNSVSGKEEENDGDYLVYYRDKKSIKILGSELQKLGVPLGHKHSELDNSSIGKKNDLTLQQLQKVQALVENKFAAIK